ncbi:unnamed protein product [Brassica napus]|uniref:(rape) hypothetical protein n=1 Tax=Brassica napus TaxID=3708 RepID=A0A816Y3R9_BRANA|nr:unnamed protein product [Brassica napus]
MSRSLTHHFILLSTTCSLQLRLLSRKIITHGTSGKLPIEEVD